MLPSYACVLENTSKEVTGTCSQSATESRYGVQGHDEIVWAVEIHNQQLFSASADKTIRVWDIASKRCERVSVLHVTGWGMHHSIPFWSCLYRRSRSCKAASGKTD